MSITHAEIREKIENLTRLIQKYDIEYYQNDNPSISDYQYDSLYKQLQEIEREHPEFSLPDSPTKRVSDKNLSGFEKVEHSIPMYSLDNTYSDGDLIDFDRKVKEHVKSKFNYCVEPKIDGVAVSLIYRESMLFKGLSRGDGQTGDDITSNIKTIHSLPLKLNFRIEGELTVRGEVFFSKEQFEILSEKYSFANPRNAASGTLKLLEPSETSKRRLSIRIHTVVTNLKETHIETMNFLKSLGLPIIESIETASDISKVIEIKNRFADERFKLPYETDGIVVKIDELKSRDEAGNTSKSPRWAFAFKFKPETAVTKVESIEFQVGRTGVITPVANLTPVHLSGTVVKRATLHNFDEIERLELMIGDFVTLEKSGEIIPKITSSIKNKRDGTENHVIKPAICPSCGEALVQIKSEVAVRCINVNCPARIELSLIHFTSKGAMNIDNMGPSLVKRLIDAGLLKSISDIYRLKKDDLLNVERMGEKSSENILAGIENSKKRDLSRFIYALGIENIGEYVSKMLASKFKNIDDFLKADHDQLISVQSIGEESANSIMLFLKNEKNVFEINALIKEGLSLKEKNKTDKLAGRSFVITGTLENYTRDEIKEKIINSGGTVSDDITKKTDFLIAGQNPGSKVLRANNYNVKIINEKDFNEMAGF